MRGENLPTVDASLLLNVLKSEIRRATGCTEVAAAALVAAKASEVLGGAPERLILSVSPNVYKNGAHVGVPGTPMRGLASAGALGAVIADAGTGLAILDAVDDVVLFAARSLLNNGAVEVICNPDCAENVYLMATAATEDHTATAVIRGAHDRFTSVVRDDTVLFRDDAPNNGHDAIDALRAVPISRLLDVIDTIPTNELEFLIEAAEINEKAATADLNHDQATLGPALESRRSQYTGLAAAKARAQALTGAASEARMSGRSVPVMAITGSGNHGIANFLGVLGLAHSLNADRNQLARALAIASIVTVCVKAYTGALTAFCGCAIAPATGLAAAAVDLLGGDAVTRDHAMQSVIGTFAGMICDGAKESCAFKVATAVGAAIDMAELALAGAYIPDGNGVVGRSLDETFARLGHLNDPGMRGTERTILEFISQNG